jgi:agmatine/peptidylarginine deiminase
MKKSFVVFLLLGLASPILAARSVDGSEELLPRGFTAEELLRKNEIGTYIQASAPPPAGTRNPAEYEPMTGVLVRWPLGVPYSLLDSIADHIKLWMVVSSANKNTCSTSLASNGVNMANVGFVIATTNSIWTRDYGPWFVMKPDGRQGIFDFAYNRPRPQDDSVSIKLGTAWNLPVYSSVLVHTGGNYMSGGHGQSMSTNLVYDENDSSNAWVDNQMLQYLGINDYVTMADPQASYIDHIDCWAKIISPTKILVLQVPTSHEDYANLEAAAAYLATQPNHYGTNWEVVRVYSSGTEGYTNSVILNDYVYVPIWNTSNDAAALQTYRNALPGYHIVGNYYGGSSGYINTDAIHCRTMGVTDSAMLWISHQPVAATQPAGAPVTIKSLIRCHPAFSLMSYKCYHRFGTAGAFDSLSMTPLGNDSFSVQIPAAQAGDTVEYFISARDNSGRIEKQPRFAPATWCHRYVTEAAGVSQENQGLPLSKTGMLQARPNPMSNQAWIDFQLAQRSRAVLSVYNIAGRKVKTLSAGYMEAGRHMVRWDGRDDRGREAAAGVYFISLETDAGLWKARLIVLR